MKSFGICKECKTKFARKSNNKVFCSEECKINYWKKQPQKPLKEKKKFKLLCKECKKIFEDYNKLKSYCSKECRSKYVGGDNISLQSFIKKYGFEEGTRKQKVCTEKIAKALTGKQKEGKHKKGYKHTIEARKKMSVSIRNSDYNKDRRGKPLPLEIRQQISNKLKGINTLRWFINKFGQIEGTEKYNERVKHISETSVFRQYNKFQKRNISKISQELFWQIYNDLRQMKNEKVYFSELNHEYSCGISHCNFDFVAKDRKKIIEYNGDMFHANPKIFKENDIPLSFLKVTAKEIWNRDEEKIQNAKNKGFEVLVIWEDEYVANKDATISKCLEFLANANELAFIKGNK